MPLPGIENATYTPQDHQGLVCSDETRTKQSCAHEADINVIVARWLKSGQPPLPTREAVYGDFSNASDYFTATLNVKAATQAFATLPARLRSRFSNNVANLLDYLDENPESDLSELDAAPPAETAAPKSAAAGEPPQNAPGGASPPPAASPGATPPGNSPEEIIKAHFGEINSE